MSKCVSHSLVGDLTAPDICRSIVFPIGPKKDAPSMVLVAGLNPCRPYDDEYREFLELLEAQLSSGLTTILNFETAQQKADELASLDRAKTVRDPWSPSYTHLLTELP